MIDGVWRYNFSTGNWALMRGTGLTAGNPVYGITGTDDPSNTPGKYYDRSHCISRDRSYLYVFGGYDGTNYIDELWRLNLSTYEWAFISGTKTINTTSTFSAPRIFASNHYPGGRIWPVMLIGEDDTIYIQGGYGRHTSATVGYPRDHWAFNGSEWACIQNDGPGTASTDPVEETFYWAYPNTRIFTARTPNWTNRGTFGYVFSGLRGGLTWTPNHFSKIRAPEEYLDTIEARSVVQLSDGDTVQMYVKGDSGTPKLKANPGTTLTIVKM